MLEVYLRYSEFTETKNLVPNVVAEWLALLLYIPQILS
jgi:hypothetical protein